jgi:DNA-binding HxlR family transcriptional regulator
VPSAQLRQRERGGIMQYVTKSADALQTQDRLTEFGSRLWPALKALAAWGRARDRDIGTEPDAGRGRA